MSSVWHSDPIAVNEPYQFFSRVASFQVFGHILRPGARKAHRLGLDMLGVEGCRIERRPPRLDMENYPHLPLAQVRTTQAADYMTLLAEVCA